MIKEYIVRQYKHIEHLSTFYQVMAGLLVLQLVTYYFAKKAEEHNLLVVMMVRALFGVI